MSKELFEAIEHVVSRVGHYTPEQGALMSIAVSLKRIADTLSDTNEYGEQGMVAMAGVLKRALREMHP